MKISSKLVLNMLKTAKQKWPKRKVVECKCVYAAMVIRPITQTYNLTMSVLLHVGLAI